MITEDDDDDDDDDNVWFVHELYSSSSLDDVKKMSKSENFPLFHTFQTSGYS